MIDGSRVWMLRLKVTVYTFGEPADVMLSIACRIYLTDCTICPVCSIVYKDISSFLVIPIFLATMSMIGDIEQLDHSAHGTGESA